MTRLSPVAKTVAMVTKLLSYIDMVKLFWRFLCANKIDPDLFLFINMV